MELLRLRGHYSTLQISLYRVVGETISCSLLLVKTRPFAVGLFNCASHKVRRELGPVLIGRLLIKCYIDFINASSYGHAQDSVVSQFEIFPIENSRLVALELNSNQNRGNNATWTTRLYVVR